MENCLVTKFKATADNNNMLPMGVVRINYDGFVSNTTIPIGVFEAYGATKDVILTIVGDAKWVTGDRHFTWVSDKKVKLKANQHYYNYNGSGGMRTLAVATDNVVSGSFYIDIENKYELNVINLVNNSKINNTEEIEYAEKLNIFVATGTIPKIEGNIGYFKKLNLLTMLLANILSGDNFGKLYGDIAALSSLTSLTEVMLTRNNKLYGDIGVFSNASNISTLYVDECNKITGDIEQLGNLTELVLLMLTNSDVSGNLNNLLDALHAAGKTSGNLLVYGKGTRLVYTGTKDILVENAIGFTFSASGWTEIV